MARVSVKGYTYSRRGKVVHVRPHVRVTTGLSARSFVRSGMRGGLKMSHGSRGRSRGPKPGALYGLVQQKGSGIGTFRSGPILYKLDKGKLTPAERKHRLAYEAAVQHGIQSLREAEAHFKRHSERTTLAWQHEHYRPLTLEPQGAVAEKLRKPKRVRRLVLHPRTA